jgi:RNA polymerase sigma-70 factor (ECF subfamily)
LDRSKFESLYETNFDAVLAYALSRSDADTAKDVTADTFLVAWRRLPDVPDDARPWLIGVARKVLADHRRSATRRDALAVRLKGHHSEKAVEPSELVATRAHVVGALRQLSASDQEVLRLVAWDGLSHSDAAAALGCTRAGFAVRLHRARRRYETALRNGEGWPSAEEQPASQRPELVGEPRRSIERRSARGDESGPSRQEASNHG